jgi:thiamine pyrophosphokinase
MNGWIVDSSDGVTLVGGGPVGNRILSMALRRAPVLVAADGGGDRALAAGLMPRAVIGDFDSLTPAARAAIPSDRQHPIPEQDTTDFDKALRSIRAPFVLGLGFSGARVDHGLAVFHTLLQHPGQPCVILGAQDAVFLSPPEISLRLVPGDRLSLFPMGPVTGESTGLRWPIRGLHFAPQTQIGTSNEVSAPQVRLSFDAAHMLVIVPRPRLDAVLSALVPRWRPPRGAAAPPSARDG